jgi:serine/threonine protein kinase
LIFNKPHGEYVLVRKLATSGMADVYLARAPEERLEELVVLKCLHDHLAEETAVVRQFYEEARLGSLFRSPNLVAVHDARLMAGRHTMVMDYAPGVTADRLFERGREVDQPLTVQESLEVCRQAAVGLHDAHQTVDRQGNLLGVIHRDTSPDNIILGFDGRVRVIDFGVADTVREGNNELEGAGKTLYMAPELCRGEPYDLRVDVYALGVVLYELLSGRSPFKRSSKAQTLQAIVRGACPPPLTEKWREVNRLVARAMARDADDRFQNAHHLAVELEGLLDEFSGEVALAERIQSHFRDERRELEQQIQKIQHAPRPSPETVDLTGSPDAELTTVREEQFEVGSEGIHTSIVRLDQEALDEKSEEFAVRATTKVDRRRAWMLVPAALLLLLVGGGATWFLADEFGWFPGPEPTASVKVETSPPGAELYLNEESLGLTSPSRVQFVAEDSPTLTAKLPGYFPVERTLDEQSPEEISLPLEIDPSSPAAPIGSVRVSFSPANANLEINGKRYEGMSPILVEGLTLQGEHTLKLQLEGFETLFFPFELDSDDTLELDLQLTEGGPLGQLSIQSVPSGAAVAINGQRIGQTPTPPIDLPANQSYTITLARAGYRTWRKGVYLREEEKTVEGRLQPAEASERDAATEEQSEEESASPSPSQSRNTGDSEYPYRLIRD